LHNSHLIIKGYQKVSKHDFLFIKFSAKTIFVDLVAQPDLQRDDWTWLSKERKGKKKEWGHYCVNWFP